VLLVFNDRFVNNSLLERVLTTNDAVSASSAATTWGSRERLRE
jgi:hypothetical protein